MKEPEAIETEAMAITRAEAPATMDVSNQTEAGLKLFAERVRVARQQISIAMKLTTASQWVVMDGGNGRETVYATSGAADRILRMGFGMRWGEWEIQINRGEKETEALASADLIQQNGDVYERYTGRRVLGGFTRNERDLIRGAIQNAKHTAVTDMLGLRFLSKADFKDLGLDLDKLERRVEFQQHEKGEPTGDVALVPFGKNKGKAITELVDKSLEWYTNAAKTSVDDPEKARWRDNNQRWLDACIEEGIRRKGGKPADTPAPDVDFGPPPMTAEQAKEMIQRTFDDAPEPGSNG